MNGATIVSVMNFDVLNEHKPQLQPSHYDILGVGQQLDACQVTHIKDAIQFIPQLDHKTLTVPVSAIDLARSVVEDWTSAQLETAPPDAMPGLFYVDGIYSVEEVEDEFAQQLEMARNKHTLWCQRLLALADELWTLKPSQRHLSANMRYAARYLKTDRVWLKAPRPEDLQKCPACTQNVPSDAVICMHCSAVLNAEKYKNIQFAGR
jgi:hypothetical protein